MTLDERVRIVMTATAIACAVVGVLLIVYGQVASDDGDARYSDVPDEATAAGILYLVGAGAGGLLSYRNGIRLMMLILLSTLSTLAFMLFGTQFLMPWDMTRGEAMVFGTLTAVSGALTLAVYLWIVWRIVSLIIALIRGSKQDAQRPPPPR